MQNYLNTAWSTPNKTADVPTSVTCPDPWGQGDKGPAQNIETGWADFSSASFSNFNATFNEEEAKQTNSEKREESVTTTEREKAKSIAQDTVTAVDDAQRDDEAPAEGKTSEKDTVL